MRRLPRLVFFLLFFTTLRAGAQLEEPAGVLAPLDNCRTALNFWVCAHALEFYSIAKSQGRVVRSDSVLSVHTGAGTLTFIDNLPEWKALRHHFVGTLPDGSFALVWRAFYDDHDYLMIDWQSGDTTQIAAPPVVSPDGERFAVAARPFDDDGSVWHAASLVQVWRLARPKPVLEFSLDGFDCAPHGLVWEDTRTIEFHWVKAVEGRRIDTRLARETAGTWRIDPPFVRAQCGDFPEDPIPGG